MKHETTQTQVSAGTSPESHFAMADVVEHLERTLVHVAEDSGEQVVRAWLLEGEAALQQNPVGDVELHRRAAVERQGHCRHRDIAEAGEVVAGVEALVRRRQDQRVRRHGAPESTPQRRVGRVRELRDATEPPN